MEILIPNTRKTWVAAPYRENAAVAIARAMAKVESLQIFYTTIYPFLGLRLAKLIPGQVGRRLERELARRSFLGIPPARVKTGGGIEELIRVASVRLVKKPETSSALMYWVKSRFDARVAATLRSGKRPHSIIGMYGSCRDTFRQAKKLGVRCILHFVNSRPCVQNQILIELGNVRPGHHEMISPLVESRVEEEVALADLILVPSRFVARQFPELQKVIVLPYGVDLRAFHPNVELKDSKVVEVLCVAQMSHRKGIRQLVEAMRTLGPKVRLRLIGPIVSPEVLTGMPSNVIYDGAVSPGDVIQAMSRADVFVLATLEDACALVILEAMACGLPVVTTYNNGSAELITDMTDGMLVPAGDVSALQQAIRVLALDSDLRRHLGNAARTKVQHSMSWDTYGANICKVLGDLA